MPEVVKGRSCTKSGASLFIATPPGDPRGPTRLGNDGGPLNGELASNDTVGGAANPAEWGGDGGRCKISSTQLAKHYEKDFLRSDNFISISRLFPNE